MKKLCDRIYSFIEKYAGKDSTGEYTSPDAYELLRCADELKIGKKPIRCWSEWGSGGYKPYTSKEGRMEHDSIVEEIYKIIKDSFYGC